METILNIAKFLLENGAAVTAVIAFLIRAIEKLMLKNKHKKELHDAYGRALQAAIVQLKNNGQEKRN